MIFTPLEGANLKHSGIELNDPKLAEQTLYWTGKQPCGKNRSVTVPAP